jgi:hypothetical protein
MMRPETFEEALAPTKSDYLRFLSAVTGVEVSSIDEYPHTARFMPFAMPTWRTVGGQDLPSDGANAEATPGRTARTGRVMGLGQEIEFNQPVARYEPLRRRSVVSEEVAKTGSSGDFTLVTVGRSTVAGRGTLVVQQERFAVRETDPAEV